MKKYIHSSLLGAPAGPYTPAVLSGNTLFLSGQIAPDATSKGIETETKQVMDNIHILLTQAGFQYTDVVSVTILLTDMAFFQQVNDVYASYFPSGSYPARMTYAVKELPQKVNVEIALIATQTHAS